MRNEPTPCDQCGEKIPHQNGVWQVGRIITTKHTERYLCKPCDEQLPNGITFNETAGVQP